MSERIPFTDKYGYDELKNMVMNIGNYTKRANLSDAEIIELLKITEGLLAGQMTKIEKKNKGGIMKQMEMFNEGGLKDEGGEVDPVSGNDVPIGSSKKEVRDDIPAMLSEGEFVFPADVVRFLGLEFLMNLRQKAKAGLKRMEEMGQMGNSDEATMPDDVPFTIDDLDMEEEKEYNEGGVVYADNGQLINRPPYGVTSQPSQMGQQFNIAPQQVDPNQTMQFTNTGGYGPQFAGQQPMQQQPVSTFQDLLGKSPGTFDEMIEYTNDKGFVQKIPFKDGEPLYPIPDGFYPVGDKPEELEDPRDVLVESARVTKDKEGDSTSLQNMKKAEADRIESYKNTIKAVMKENTGFTVAQAIKHIQDGKHKILGIPVPGILFKDFNTLEGDEFGLEQAGGLAQIEIDDENAMIEAEETGAEIKQDVTTGRDITGSTVSDDITKRRTAFQEQAKKDEAAKKEAEAKRKQAELAKMNEKQKATKAIQDVIEKERAKREERDRRQEERDAMRATGDTTTNLTVAPSKASGLSREQQLRGIKQGGLVSKKPKKKKVMKRGGLASKK